MLHTDDQYILYLQFCGGYVLLDLTLGMGFETRIQTFIEISDSP